MSHYLSWCSIEINVCRFFLFLDTDDTPGNEMVELGVTQHKKRTKLKKKWKAVSL